MNGLNELLIKKKMLFNSIYVCAVFVAASRLSLAAAMGLLSSCGDGGLPAAAMGAPPLRLR